jgi:DNA-binding beta-propeller fold protein YncE
VSISLAALFTSIHFHKSGAGRLVPAPKQVRKNTDLKGESLMKRRFFLITICILIVTSYPVVGLNPTSITLAQQSSAGKIVVANRASGTISVIDVQSDLVTGTFALPAGANAPEPMYVVQVRKRVFVGDRANNRVVVFNAHSFTVEGTVPAGAGVFHMWADPLDRQLWVNNDIDKTATVIDPITLDVLATVPLPADLSALGGKPHDVILDPIFARFAYVTMIGVAGASDYVVQYSTQNFQEVGRAPVGKDPHLSVAQQNKLLYVPCQGSNVVIVLDRTTLQQLSSIAIPAAHGAGMARNGQTFYTTNIAGGGPNGLFVIDTKTNTLLGGGINTPFATPHNIALTPNGHKLYLSHSGATSNKVTIYKISQKVPYFSEEVTVGFNPFGIAYVQ